MAVEWIREDWPERGSDGNGLTDSSATRCWKVRTTDKTTSWGEIQSYGIANGYFPARFAPHPDNGYLTARRIRSENQSESPLFWVVTVEYSSKPLKEQEREKENPDPLDRRAKITWSTTIYQVRIEEDVNGHAILNSAGERFPDPPEKDASHWTATVVKNVSAVPAWILDYNDCPVNDDEFDIGGVTVQAGCARLYELRISDLQEENGIEYYQLSFTLEFRKEGWTARYLNQGFKEIVDIDSTPTLVIATVWNEDDREYQRASSPVLLDADGYQIENPEPSDATFEEYTIYEEVDFSVLPLE